MKKKPVLKILIALLIINVLVVQKNCKAQTDSVITLKLLLANAINHSQQIKNQSYLAEKSKIDEKKAKQSYYPKIAVEANYTHLNDNINLPSDMISLLESTQRLLIKEGIAMQMAALGSTTAEKYFATSYKLDPNNPTTAGTILNKTITEKFKATPPIQKQDILKASISAQMILFSGMKIPYSIKAAQHQTTMYQLLGEKEKSSLINSVASTYYRLAVLAKSEEVLNNTEKYLNEQNRYIQKAIKNGLATDFENQKIQLAQQQLLSKRIELNTSQKMVISYLGQLTGVDAEKLTELKPILEIDKSEFTLGNISERKDLQALEEAIKATDLKKKIEFTEYIPKVFAYGKKELRTADLSTFDPEWMVGVGVKWTLFDGFASVNSSKQAKIDQLILENKREESKELLNLNLQKSLFEVEKCNQLLMVSEQQIKTAEKMYEISQKRYQLGINTLNDHLQSINELEKANLEHIKAIYNQKVAILNLKDAKGILNSDNL